MIIAGIVLVILAGVVLFIYGTMLAIEEEQNKTD